MPRYGFDSATSARKQLSRCPGDGGVELRDSKLDRSSPSLPVPVKVAVAPDDRHRDLLAVAGTRRAADFELRQPLGRKGGTKLKVLTPPRFHN